MFMGIVDLLCMLYQSLNHTQKKLLRCVGSTLMVNALHGILIHPCARSNDNIRCRGKAIYNPLGSALLHRSKCRKF